MASSRRTYDTDTITLRQVFAKNGNNSNIPALRVLTADGAGGTYWAIPSTLGVNPAFNQIITSAGTFTADLSYNTFRLLAGENMGMYGGPPGSNQTTLFAKAYSQIDVSGENTLFAFANGNLDPSLKIAGEGGIQVRADPATNTLFIDGPAPPIFVVSTGIYGFNQIKITEATSTITSSVQNFDGTFITADSPSTLLRFLGYNDIQLSTNTTTNSIYFTISTFTSKDYLNISNAAYSAYPSSISTVSSLYVRQDQFYSTLGFFSSQTGFNFSSVVSSINALAMSTGSNFYILSGLINERLTIAQFLQYQADDRQTLNSTMASTVAGLGVSQTSTVIGLGTAGYLSTAVALVSSSQEFLTSSIIGLGSAGYISSAALTDGNLISTVKGLGSAGYISSLSSIITSSIFNTGAISTYDLEVFGSNTFSVRGNAFFRGPTNICTMTVSSINGIAAANFGGGGGSGGTVGFPSSISTQFGSIFTTSKLFVSTQNAVNIQPSTASQYLALGYDRAVATSSFVFSSSNGSNWSRSVVFNPYNRFDGGIAIAWNGNMWVGCGIYGENLNTGELYPCFQYSTDGINWLKASDYLDNGGDRFFEVYYAYMTDVKWNGNMWVAIGFDYYSGSNASLKYSYNGRTWSNGQGEGFNNLGGKVAWDGTKWLAFGPRQGTNSNTTIKYSYNGINWSTVNQVALGRYFSGAWNGQMWVGVGSNGNTNPRSISYSYDGFYWQLAINSVELSSSGVRDVAWNGNQWVASGISPNFSLSNPMRYSTDGIYWYQASTITQPFLTAYRVLWSGTQWLTTTQLTSSFYTSQDGKFWRPGNSNSNVVAYGIAYSSNISPSYSQNGLTIFDSNSVSIFPSTNTMKPWTGGLIIDDILQINRSTNTVGIKNFNPEYTLDVLGSVRGLDANFSTIQKISVNPSTLDTLIRVGSYNSSGDYISQLSRNNGSNWNRINLGVSASPLSRFAWNGNMWVSVGIGESGVRTIRLSYDGINWILPNMTQSDQFFSTGSLISWNGNMWVAFGTDVDSLKRTFYSYDAFNWFPATGAVFDFNAYAKDLKWDGTKWLVFGDQNNNINYRSIQYSYDGKSWSFVQNVPFRNTVKQGVWNGSVWVCVGEDPFITSTIAYSSDGFNWSYANTSFAGDYDNFFPEAYAVGWDGRKFLVSGKDSNNNNLLYSYNGREWFPYYFPIFTSNIQWYDYRWIALVNYEYNSPLTSSIVYSFDGFNWLNMGPESMIDANITAIGYTSNINPAYQQNGFAINTLNTPLNYTSTNNIQVLQSSMIINNTMYVDKRFNFVGINNPSPENPLDVFGGGRFLSLSTLNINISTINNAKLSDLAGGGGSVAGCNLVSTTYLNPSLASTLIGLGTSGYISSPSLFSTTAGVIASGQTIVQSTSVGLGTLGYLSSLDNVLTRTFINTTLQSTTSGLGTARYISTQSLTSSLVGIAGLGFLTPTNLTSSLVGIGTLGYLSSASLTSSLVSLSTLNASSFTTTNLIVSTISPMSVRQQGIYVAGGAANDSRSMLYSYNGLNWIDTGVDFYCTSIVYTGTMFLATGAIPFKYSYNGLTWYNSSNDNTVLLSGQVVGYNGSYFVAGGQSFTGPAVAYSADGINWTKVQTLSAFSVTPYSVAWNGRLWVMGGDSSNIYYSVNGRAWSLATMPNNSNNAYFSIDWNGSYFMAVGGIVGNTTPQPAISPDGITWTYPYTLGNAPWGDGNAALSVIWDGSYWVVAVRRNPDSNCIFYSQDGVSWGSNVSGMFNGYPTTLLWDGNRYFCGGSNNSGVDLAYSTDFVNWSTMNITGFPSVGQVGALAYSSNSPVYKQSNLEITNGYNPTYYGSTMINTVAARLSTLYINNTLVIDGTNKQMGVNCNAPRFTMDVAGSLNVSSFFISSFSFTNILTSTVAGIGGGGGGGGLSQTNLTSTVQGLGTVGYLSTGGTLTTLNLTSTVRGLGTSGYLSTIVVNLTSTVQGLGTAGYISTGGALTTLNLTSTVRGLGTTGYLSTAGGGSSDFSSTISTSYGTSFTGLRLNISTVDYLNVIQSTPNIWVAVGSNSIYNNIRFSYDGRNWSNANWSFDTNGNGVAYNGKMWVGVGQDSFDTNNTIIYSYNGIDWASSASGAFGAAGRAVAWNGRMWVAVGEDYGDVNNTIKYSYDGINWSNSLGTGFGQNLGNGVAWNGRMWVAVGGDNSSNATIKYSFNGITWSNITSGGFEGFFASGIAWNGRIWIAVGNESIPNGTIKYSYNGSNWLNITSGGFTTSGKAVAWNGTIFVATGVDSSSNGTIKNSRDGLVWSNALNNGFTSQGTGIAWNGSQWVATGIDSLSNAMIKYSTDALNWSNSTGESFAIYGFGVGFSSNTTPSYNQSNFSILPQKIPLFLTSTNTILAQASSMVINNTLHIDSILNRVGINTNTPQYNLDVNGSANMGPLNASNVFLTNPATFWVAVGSDTTQANRIKYSYNGITWSNSYSGSFTGQGNTVAYNGTIWLAGGSHSSANGTIQYSLDGFSWSNILSGGFTTAAYKIAWNGRMWVAVGSNSTLDGNIKYSYNGLNWSNTTGAVFSNTPRSVAWNGYIWVAVGDQNSGTPASAFKYSLDGISWIDGNSVPAGYTSASINDVAWNGRIWVAAALAPATSGGGGNSNDSLLVSSNGLDWVRCSSGGFAGGSGFDGRGNTVAWNGNLWVASGFGGTTAASIKYSVDGFNWSNRTAGGFDAWPGGWGVSWNGKYWVAVGAGTLGSRIQYSFDGLQWTNASSGWFSGTGREGKGVANNSNAYSYQQEYLSILPQNIPIFNTSTNTIFAQPSSLVINNTLEVDAQWNRVGINCNIPRYTLDVVGNGSFSTLTITGGATVLSTNTDFALTVFGTQGVARVGGTTWTAISDKRVKDNIVSADLEMCYNDIKNIPLRRFTYTSTFFQQYNLSDKNVLGFIAQEVSTVQPKAITVSPGFGFQDMMWLNIDQLNMSLYGSVKKLIQDKESADSTIRGQAFQLETLNGRFNSMFSTLEGLQGR